MCIRDRIDSITVVCVNSHIKLMKLLIQHYNLSKVSSVIPGGASGQESIRNGLLEIGKEAADDDIVLIHDGVRPIIDEDLISKNILSVRQYGSAISSSQMCIRDRSQPRLPGNCSAAISARICKSRPGPCMSWPAVTAPWTRSPSTTPASSCAACFPSSAV